VQPRERSGFELSPHAADVMIHAWSSTVDGCCAEAVRGFVASFANIDIAQPPQRAIPFAAHAAPGADLVVEVLEEAIQVVETQNVVPVRVTAIRTPEGGVAGEFGVVDSSTVDVFGPAPRAVDRQASHIEHEDGSWICHVPLTI
jgi:SHS2 domain-containing protein